MSSAICFNLNQSKILLSGNGLIRGLMYKKHKMSHRNPNQRSRNITEYEIASFIQMIITSWYLVYIYIYTHNKICIYKNFVYFNISFITQLKCHCKLGSLMTIFFKHLFHIKKVY